MFGIDFSASGSRKTAQTGLFFNICLTSTQPEPPMTAVRLPTSTFTGLQHLDLEPRLAPAGECLDGKSADIPKGELLR